MNLEAYLRHGIAVIFCPHCQVVRQLTRQPTGDGSEWDYCTCAICGSQLEVVAPTDGSTPAIAK